MKHDIIGIGHPLMDICIEIDDALLDELGLSKGGMHLFESTRFQNVLSRLDKSKLILQSGGSVPNTIDGLRHLGLKVAEYGKIGNDEYGKILADERKKAGITSFLSTSASPTGTVLALISKDSQRTFIVSIGAAADLSDTDINEEIIAAAKIIHFTGYEFEDPNPRRAIDKAVSIAKKHQGFVSLDLADPGVISRNLISLRHFVHSYVDILFANESEIAAYSGLSPELAIEKLHPGLRYLVIKLGEDGSIIRENGNVFRIDSFKVEAKDTTGAGDMYAAGILYGIIKNLEMDKAGKIAAYISAKVVEKIGARVDALDISKLR